MKMLTKEEFYDKVNTPGYVTSYDIAPYKTGAYDGSAYDAYLIWHKLEHSPLGQALK